MLRSVALAGVVALLGGTANANIIFTPGNHPQTGEKNIFFQAPEIGFEINGQVDHSGIDVKFDSTEDEDQKAEGQADIFCTGTCATAFGKPALNNIRMFAPGFGFGDAIINLNNGTGTATVVVSDNLGNSFTYTLDHGQNYLTMVAEPGSGEVITSIQVNVAGGGFEDFKQPRVSGVCALQSATSCQPVVIPTPEPASMAVLGAGVLGLVALRRKRRQ